MVLRRLVSAGRAPRLLCAWICGLPHCGISDNSLALSVPMCIPDRAGGRRIVGCDCNRDAKGQGSERNASSSVIRCVCSLSEIENIGKDPQAYSQQNQADSCHQKHSSPCSRARNSRCNRIGGTRFQSIRCLLESEGKFSVVGWLRRVPSGNQGIDTDSERWLASHGAHIFW
jgi:hypothetical protein